MDTDPVLASTVLQELDLGNSVAEQDEALEQYFVETQTFRAIVRDEADIVAGDKGTGKTAVFRILQRRYPGLDELAKVEVIPAINPAGNPVFQRLTEAETLEEGQYITIWKAYLLALVGNWVLGISEGAFSPAMEKLDALLLSMGLRTADDSPGTVFSQLVNLVRRITNPKAVEMAVTLTPNGFPIVVPRIEFGDEPGGPAVEVGHDQALGLLQEVLEEIDVTSWVVFDRLDEAFQGYPAAEVPALRALLRTYLDLAEFDRIRMKLFLRKDLFRRIIGGGFVNLTHVNARKIEIVWEEDDLAHLLTLRIRENAEFLRLTGAGEADRDELFRILFPEQVDAGDRKPSTWTWMMSRVRDANHIRPPRNLIDLVKKAQDAQLRKEDREANAFEAGRPLIKSDSIKQGLTRLSNQRVEDTLLAEAGEYQALIERFRGGKAEHSAESIAETLGLGREETVAAVKILKDLGFLEEVGDSFKIPILYREGLGITQGKAFGNG